MCVFVCAGIVGDDALQSRVKSRGGREFLCASRPVFPLASSPLSVARQPPSPRYVTPLPAPTPSLFSSSRPAYNRGRFESGSRWTRGTSRESGAAGGETEEGGWVERGQEGEAERARNEREGQKSGDGQWEEVPEPRERQEPTTSLELEFLFIARAPRGGEPRTYLLLLLLLLLRGSISIGINSSNIIGAPTVTSAATATNE